MLAAPAPEDAATTLPEESIVMFDAVKLPTAGLIILGINYLSSLKLIYHLYI
jgi:hypothetical protein